MKRTLLPSLGLAALASVSLMAGGCIYATHAPGEGTRLAVAPPPVVEVEPAPVYVSPAPVYVAPAPVYYGPPVSFNFGFGYWGGHHGHWHH